MSEALYTSELARSLAAGLLERFDRYVRIDTQAARERTRSPSSPGQLELGRVLVEDLRAAGLADATLDDNGYVTATLAGTRPDAPVIGWIAHLDTSPDAPGAGVQPLVHRRYGGEVIALPRSGTRLDPATMPELATKHGHDIVTSSGDTLLGADDKAGVAEIVTAVAHLAAHPELERPTVRVAFTPDEEIGQGASRFDLGAFGARCAYTVDGSEIGELQDESFSAVEVRIAVRGVDVHPGTAHRKLVNALRVLAAIIDALPGDRLSPETTAQRDGFLHPHLLEGDAARARLHVIARDFDDELLAEHVALLRGLTDAALERFPGAGAEFEVREQYRNMKAYIAPEPQVVAAAEAALRAEGIEPVRTAIRGGTDGSLLSEMGLPTPNLFTGGHEYHSVREWASLNDMAAAAATLVRLAGVWAANGHANGGGVEMSGPGPSSLASLDGEIMPVGEATISVADHGLVRGDGAFEVMRVYDGHPFALDAHLARLQRSSANLRLPVDLEAVRADTWRLLAAAGTGPDHALVRVMVTRGGRRVLITERLPERPELLRCKTVTYAPTRIMDGVKSLSYGPNMLAGRLAQEEGYDEAILVTPHGRVLEAPTSSVFWVEGQTLLTPPLEDHILASITRAIILQVTDAREQSCPLERLLAADEVFIASTTREAQGVIAINAREFAAPGPVTLKTEATVAAHIASELALDR